MALLDNLFGQRQSLQPMMGSDDFMQNLAPFMQAMEIAQSDPFQKLIKGEQFLGQPNSNQPVFQQQETMENLPTDFGKTSPGLPNLPQDFQGFGYGQNAPKLMMNPFSGVRQSLIGNLFNNLMSRNNGYLG